jgi:DNA modification methylase
VSITIRTGDCRDALAKMPAESVQCCVTSPPYFGLRDYGNEAQIGLEPTPDAYVAEMVAVFREVRRVLRDDGVAFINLGDSYAGGGTMGRNDAGKDIGGRGGNKEGSGNPGSQGQRKPVSGLKPKDLIGIPWLVAFALRADGWYLRQDIIWQKPNPMPESVTDRCTKAHEYVFLLSKSARYYFDAKAISEEGSGRIPGNKVPQKGSDIPSIANGGSGLFAAQQRAAGTRNKRSVWPIATQPYSGAHFATMPPELAETCIKAGSSERGQCPQCGAPWVRQVERTATGRGDTKSELADGIHARSSGKSLAEKRQAYRALGLEGPPRSETTGWEQSCACPAHQPVPQMILDPFGGAGTTALVADRLQRDATIIELNPTYAALARDRIEAEAGLFAMVAAE